MTEVDVIAVRGAALLLPLSLTTALWHWRRPDVRLAAAVLLGVVWNMTALLAINVVALGAGWWSFAADGGVVLGVPVDLLAGWALLWGAAPVLVLPRQFLWVAVPGAVLLDLVVMPLLAPVVVLSHTWLVGEGVAAVVALIPGLLLANWTAHDQRLYARVALQVVLAGVLVMWLLPAATLDDPRGVLAILTDVPVAAAVLLVVFFGLGSLLGVAAVVEFAVLGHGTPLPYDPPHRLVTSGPYAYCRTPMQTSICAMLATLAVVAVDVRLAVAAVVSVAYGSGLAQWHEVQQLPARFGAPYHYYRTSVPAWRLRWRPSPGGTQATLWVGASCRQCSPVGDFFVARHPVRLAVRAAEDHPGAPPIRITYEAGDRRWEGVAALARAVEHLNLAWAFCGWFVRLPGVAPLLQVIVDASGGGPRQLTASTCAAPASARAQDDAAAVRRARRARGERGTAGDGHGHRRVANLDAAERHDARTLGVARTSTLLAGAAAVGVFVEHGAVIVLHHPVEAGAGLMPTLYFGLVMVFILVAVRGGTANLQKRLLWLAAALLAVPALYLLPLPARSAVLLTGAASAATAAFMIGHRQRCRLLRPVKRRAS